MNQLVVKGDEAGTLSSLLPTHPSDVVAVQGPHYCVLDALILSALAPLSILPFQTPPAGLHPGIRFVPYPPLSNPQGT